ncbi:hypothetical protein [Streptomyces sp. NPDC046371]|uniref:hypothetical protein n=1 Tax=Streptomyces sp. NPDC046371 TaxID=3154916 RepID=UPI0033ECC416
MPWTVSGERLSVQTRRALAGATTARQTSASQPATVVMPFTTVRSIQYRVRSRNGGAGRYRVGPRAGGGGPAAGRLVRWGGTVYSRSLRTSAG